MRDKSWKIRIERRCELITWGLVGHGQGPRFTLSEMEPQESFKQTSKVA